MSSDNSIFVIAEHGEGHLDEVTTEVLTCGRKLADDLDGNVIAAVFGNNNQALAVTLGSYGADKVIFLNSPLLQEYRAEFYIEALANLFTDKKPEIVLCGATPTGRDLAPRLAARLGTGLISDCVSLTLNEEGLLLGNKLTYGGRVNSTIVCPNTKPQIATLKPGVISISRPDNTRKPEVIVITPQLSHKEPSTRVKGFTRADPETISLDEADIIVAGGRGVGSQAHFQLLHELAKLLGGVVAGSLGAIDEGWLPRKKLVGQTGTTVAPRLYLACGISGSVYHVLGMRDSEFVIAIDKDPNAPIFKVADMSIVGDLSDIVPAIIERIKKFAANTDTRNSE